MADLTLRVLGGDEAAVLGSVEDGVFDGPIRPDLLREFLDDPRHHLAIASDGERVVGVASAVHYVHPDKPAELWINEVGVAPRARGRGIGTRLVDMLLEHGRTLGCRQAWVVAEVENAAARALYEGCGGRATEATMYSWTLEGS